MAVLRPLSALAAGVLAAGQLGSVSPVGTALDRDLHLSPALGGLAISLLTVVAALAGAPAALAIGGRPATRLVVSGLVTMAVPGALAAAVARSAGVFLLLRGVAGLGYVLVVVAGPGLLLAQVRAERRSWALALWGSCIPAGLALAAAGGGLVGSALGWRGWFALVAALTAATAVLVARCSARTAVPVDRATAFPRWSVLRRVVCLAAAFGLIASVSVSVVSVLPGYLHGARGLSASTAGSLTSVVAIASVPGSVLAGALLRRPVHPAVLGLAILGCPALAVLGFAAMPLPIVLPANVVLVFLAGIGVSAAYGALPAVADARGVLPIANGLLVQLGSLGTLVAPPVFAAVTGPDRWQYVPLLLVIPAIGGAVLLAWSLRPAPPSNELCSSVALRCWLRSAASRRIWR